MRPLLLALLLVGAAPTVQATQKLALFPFELVNTSLEQTRPEEEARLAMVEQVARDRFAADGLALADLSGMQAELERISSLRGCNGCELALARDSGAEFAAVGWVQKVSNLILNINLQVRDAGTGRLLAAGSVDIRGNNDESWRRGIQYLLKHRILQQR